MATSLVGDSDYKCSFSGDVLEKAKKELNEEPNTRLLEVKNLRQRVMKLSGLRPKLDFTFLLAFLRARKFEQERSYQLIKNHYAVKRDNHDIFDDLKPSRIRHVIDFRVIEVLRHRDNNGCRVVVMRPGRSDPDSYPLTEFPKLLFLVLSKLAEDEETQVHGVHIVNNLADISWKHAARLTPSLAKRIIHIMQDVIPLRLKRLDYVNEPTFFDVIFPIMKQFMKEKLVKRIFLNGPKPDKLHTTINPDYLPTDLGGKMEIYEYKEWVDDLIASDEKFEEENKYGYLNMSVDQKGEVGRSGDAGMQGLGGTFKKLQV